MFTPAFLPKALLSKPNSLSIITPAKFPQHFCPSVLTQHFCPSISRSFQQLLIFNCFKYLLQYFCQSTNLQALLFFPSNFFQNFPPKSLYSSICAPDFLPQCFGLRIFVMAVLPQHFYKFLIFQMFQMFAPAFLVQHYCPNIFALLFLLQHFCPCLFITSILPQHFFALVFLEVSRSFGKFHEVV